MGTSLGGAVYRGYGWPSQVSMRRYRRLSADHSVGGLHVGPYSTGEGEPERFRQHSLRRVRRHGVDGCRATGLGTRRFPSQGDTVAGAVGLRDAQHHRGLRFLKGAGGWKWPPYGWHLQQGPLCSKGGLPEWIHERRHRSSTFRSVATVRHLYQCGKCRRFSEVRLLDIPAVLEGPRPATGQHHQPRSAAGRHPTVALHFGSMSRRPSRGDYRQSAQQYLQRRMLNATRLRSADLLTVADAIARRDGQRAVIAQPAQGVSIRRDHERPTISGEIQGRG